MTDYLIMLLSTDWFFPFWPFLGLNADEKARTEVMMGCREIVGTMLNGADQYYLIDFSLQRRERTATEFSRLLKKSHLDTTSDDVVAEWANMTQAELKATWTFTRLTRELFSGDAGDGRPVLEFSIRAEALAAFEEPEPPDFVDACLESQTPWDEFIRSLEPGLPELLPDLLISVLRERRFREFWHRMCERLSSTQRDELVSWYEVMARFRREQYDLRPNCMSGS